jgi:hypothetical protein
MADNPTGPAFYIVDLRPEWRRLPYVTLWRPDDAGYCYSIPWAGKYTLDRVRQAGAYYVKRLKPGDRYFDKRPVSRSTWYRFPVRCAAANKMAQPEPAPGIIDGDVGPVLPNTAEMRRKLLRAAYLPEALLPEFAVEIYGYSPARFRAPSADKARFAAFRALTDTGPRLSFADFLARGVTVQEVNAAPHG